MIACEVTKHEVTGRPCPGDGTSFAVLVYPSGKRETKRCCPHHRTVIEAASAEAEREIAQRAEARRQEADRRIAALQPNRPKDSTMPTPEMTGLRGCRWPGCKDAGHPLCKSPHRTRILAMVRDGDVPDGFDAATCDPADFVELWAARQGRLEREAKAKRGPALPAIVAVTNDPVVPVKTCPLAPFLSESGEAAPLPIDFVPVPPLSEVAERGLSALGPHPKGIKCEAERDAALAEVEILRRESAYQRAEMGAAHLTLDAAQVQSGPPLDRRISKLADRAREYRDEWEEVGKARDEAVDTFASLRADSAELAALLAFMRNGGNIDGLSRPTHRALADYDDRRGIGDVPDRKPAYDVPRLLAVTQYAAAQLFDLVEVEIEAERIALPEVVRALRALTLGRVPEPRGSTGEPG